MERITIHSDPSDFWVDDVYVKNLPSLTSLEFHNIEKLDYLRIEKCPRLNPNTILEAIRDGVIGELVIDGEIVDIDVFQRKTGNFHQVTEVNGGLPGIHGRIVDIEHNVLAIRVDTICPVVISIDFRIEC